MMDNAAVETNARPSDPSPRSKPSVSVTDLRKLYDVGGESVSALSGATMHADPGEFVAVMGSSGSGKSTLLHLIGGLDKPTSGSVRMGDRDLAQMSDRDRTLFRRHHIGIVFQAFNLLPTLSALENVMLPAMIDGRSGARLRDRAKGLLDAVDLGHRMNHRPQALAGGEQQRVALARALVNDPIVVLADEPTGNLDTQHAEEVWRLLARLAREQGCTVIAVTHEPRGATFADRVVVLKDGLVTGEIKPDGEGNASVVAARYATLVG